MRKPAVIATTTFVKDINDVRAKLAIQMVAAAKQNNYRVVVVNSSPADFQSELTERGAIVFHQDPNLGMGSSRRQAMTEAAKLAKEHDAIIWMEPEKWTLVQSLDAIMWPVVRDQYDLVVPERSQISLSSYPPEQQHAEMLGNLAFQYLTGKHLDAWFGPFAMNQKALKYFLEYDGEYGDKWDSIFIPRLRIIKDGLRVASVLVDYVHPKEQTKEETGNLAFLVKRIEQLLNLVPALQKEAQKLGTYPG